jgi:hypothetical protein
MASKRSDSSLPSFNVASEKGSPTLKPDGVRIEEIDPRAATPLSDDEVEPPPPPDGGLQAWVQCLMTHLVGAAPFDRRD